MNTRILGSRWIPLFTLLIANTVLANDYTLSEPYTHQNLTIHVVHSAQTETHAASADIKNLLTLDEALTTGKAVVYETSDVNELSVENLSADKVVFIQAGDIVKGGKQDRVMSTDLLLRPKSGKVAIDSFCVEQGRWQARDLEDSRVFNSSKKRLSSKELKIAAVANQQQGEVWDEVEQMQSKLEAKVTGPIKDGRSETSLQLSLENSELKKMMEGYIAKFDAVVTNDKSAIGYVASINGEISSADIFVAPSLFKKQWPKLLESAATEALAEQGTTKDFQQPSDETVLSFIAEAQQGEEQAIRSKNLKPAMIRKESDDSYYHESRIDSNSESWVHKGFIKK